MAGLEEMADYYGRGLHCDKKKVGDPIVELPWGIPVSERYAAPLNTLITDIIQNG
eukprot:CAMPEP_0172558752 /NCGR_PEP_ID=MMETSP1067-20121228/80766_1 /TAXON_ID=265564 ORGANISM="Thalassiosira punctigera, Strain Tpunct2005C2" /NCGR_SAMPLE_ID=MMETSP1067 /ASSEMBLY_ACC=CAM_ASM_000444 /LENGTH=54 /DNA_ID=CAMNT_0013348185 /DNA_START=24 /DNA_END=185 /DNA_ORIENTATION=-